LSRDEERNFAFWPVEPYMKKQLLYITAAMVLMGAIPGLTQTASGSADVSAIAAISVESPQQFVDMGASSNMFEIESSRLALDKSQQEELRTFAQHMIDDHTAAGEQMMAAAQADGVTMPTEMQAKHQEMLDQLNAASNEEFDQLYTQMQVQAHEEAIGLFKGFAETGSGQLQSFAQATLPTLEEHYTQIQGMMQ
jgi:putative membrane protein